MRAGQEKHARSDELLSRYDASLSVMTMLEACLHGDSMFGGAWWALEEVVQAVQSLSQKPQHAERLVKVCGWRWSAGGRQTAEPLARPFWWQETRTARPMHHACRYSTKLTVTSRPVQGARRDWPNNDMQGTPCTVAARLQ